MKPETYVPESQCKAPSFDVLGSNIEWNGGVFYFTRSTVDLRTIGRPFYRFAFNLFRFAFLLPMALVFDLALMLFVFILKLLGLSMQKAVEQAAELVKDLVTTVFNAVIKLLIFSGYLLIIITFYLKYSQIKHFILSLFK